MNRILLLGILALLPLLLYAQKTEKGAIRGNVYDKETAEPVSFATVQLEGVALGATTDVNGFFTITNIPAGNYKINVSYLGYDPYSAEITVRKGEILYQKIYLTEGGTQIEEIVISGRKEQARNEVQVSKLSVTPKQIRSLPSAGGQADIAQYLTVLPGVIFTGDQGGQLYIRGGSPVQNRIMLDGMTIYNPFHSIGFFSVFETELIRNVDVFTGGFNSDYGGRISAVVDVKTREGNRKRLAGQVSASPFQGKVLLEGPIVPLRSDNGASVSFIVTAKQAFINQLDKQLYSYVNDTTGIPFDYRDFYGKVSLMAGNGSRINVFGFNYTDKVNFPIAAFDWKSNGGGLDFSLVPTNSNTIVGGSFTFSGYDSGILESDRLPRNSGIRGLQAGLNFTNFDRNNEVKYGLEFNNFRTDFQYINFKGLTFEQIENTTEVAAYVRWKTKIGPLVIEPGFRFQYYVSLNDYNPEPRLGLKYNITDSWRFKAAAGYYSQNLLSTVNERDIVNLFVGFLSAPEERPIDLSTGEEAQHRLQKALHGVAGFEFDLPRNIELNVEGYYKRFTQLIALNRNKQTLTAPDYVTETGDAYGIDLSFKYEGRHAYLWGAYSLGYVLRNDGLQEYPPVFDRRHNLNLVATYQLGKNNAWEFGARWNLGSGFPFTLTQGFYTSYLFNDGVSTDVIGGNGDNVGILYFGERNTGRLPYYHRLDLSAKRTFTFTKHLKLEVTASATNVYDRPNIFYFDRVRATRVNQLPLLPSLSMTLQF